MTTSKISLLRKALLILKIEKYSKNFTVMKSRLIMIQNLLLLKETKIVNKWSTVQQSTLSVRTVSIIPPDEESP